jgi:glycosyltransferase involved in cell wall biosynthesis
VQGRVQRLGLEDKVILTGPVTHEDVPAHIAALDIALQPRATAYACPLKLLEYMALARCIVAPDQPNIRELLSDGRTARLFPVGNYQRLVDSIYELMQSPAERASLGRNAHRAVVERNLFWRANAMRVLGLLRSEQHDEAASAPAKATGCPEASSGSEAVR